MKTLNILIVLFLSMSLTAEIEARVYDYTQNNKLTLLEDPAESVDYKIELIRNAKHHVHIITFFWDNSSVPARLSHELNIANARGVEVRILTSFVPTLTTDILGSGKRALNLKSKTATFSYLQLMPGHLFSLTSNLHEKMFIVDGEKAIIGGRNSSASSLNGKDIEVVLEGEVVNQVQDHFKVMQDFLIEDKIKSKCVTAKDLNLCAQSVSSKGFSNKDQNFFPNQPIFTEGVEARIISHEAVIHQRDGQLSRQARLNQQDDILDTVTKIKFKKLRGYNYFIMPTQRYMNFLESSLAEGDSIELITNSIESAKFSSNAGYIYSLPDMKDLMEQGLVLHLWERNQKMKYVHEKVLIFDDERVIIGSHNFGTGSTTVSNEIAVEFTSKEIAKRLIDVFTSEVENPLITKTADMSLIDKQIKKYKGSIKILRKKIVEGVLRETY